MTSMSSPSGSRAAWMSCSRCAAASIWSRGSSERGRPHDRVKSVTRAMAASVDLLPASSSSKAMETLEGDGAVALLPLGCEVLAVTEALEVLGRLDVEGGELDDVP